MTLSTREAQKKLNDIQRNLWNSKNKEKKTFRRQCKKYIDKRVERNYKKRKELYKQFKNNDITEEQMQELISETSWYHPIEYRNELIEMYISGQMTADEFYNKVLKYAIDDTFTRTEILESIGRNPKLMKINNWFYELFGDMRNAFLDAFDVIYESEDCQKRKQQGVSDEEIWFYIVEVMARRNVYPMYGVDGRYHLMHMHDYTTVKNRRMESVSHEVEGTVKNIKKISDKLPELIQDIEKPKRQLKDTPYREMLPVANECPICAKICEDEEELKKHLLDDHDAKI